MSTTPNLKLNLFNGNDRPNHELFNENNQIIDNILVKASTHDHDGVNSAKIKATNVVFNSTDTTLSANNLEDAVKEVFQEADSKIQWITDTIGTTSSGVSNPDAKVDEILSDFQSAKQTYLENMKKATIFKVQGTLPSSNASIKEINDAINNTTYKDATGTSDDIVAGYTAIDKYGVPVTGTINDQTQTIIMPNSSKDVVFKKGAYQTFSLMGFGTENPEVHIRKGCNILGVQGLLSEHGSNGWDIGEYIHNSKLTQIHKDSCYLKELLHSNYIGNSTARSSFVSVKYPITITVGNKSIIAQHFKVTAKGELIAYTSNFRDYVIKSINDLATSTYGTLSRNPYTNQNGIQIVQHPHASYIISLNNGYIVIVNLSTFNTVYSQRILDGSLFGMVVNKDNKTNLSKVVIYGKYNGNYYSTVIKSTNTEDTNATWSSITYVLGPDIYYSLVDTNGRHSVEVIPKYTSSTKNSNKLYTTNCKLDGQRLFLNAGDKIKINRLIKPFELFEIEASIPIGGASSKIRVSFNDSNGGTFSEDTTISSTSSATVSYISEVDDNIITIECISGQVKLHGIHTSTYDGLDVINKLFSKEWGFMGHNLVPMGQLKIDGTYDMALVWSGSHTDIDEATSTAMIGISQIDLTKDLLEKIPKIRRCLSISDMYLGSYQTVDINHSCLSFMSEYDGYLFGTFPNKQVSSVAVTGTRYYKFNRKLVKIGLSVNDANDLAINKEKESYGLHYRLFKPMFINHLGEVIGLERGATLNKFTYLTKLNSNLSGGLIDVNWSEDFYRTAEEEMKILDDGTCLNTLRMFTGVIRCYNEDNTLSNTKLLGNVYKSSSEYYDDTTADMGASIDLNKSYYNGFVSIFNPVYKINDIRQV